MENKASQGFRGGAWAEEIKTFAQRGGVFFLRDEGKKLLWTDCSTAGSGHPNARHLLLLPLALLEYSSGSPNYKRSDPGVLCWEKTS